jgi:hypothetical protein
MIEPAWFRFVVPAYIHPTTGAGDWAQLVQFAGESALVVVNVDNGPGHSVDDEFATALGDLAATGVVVLGYIHTRWGARPPFDVVDDVLRWLDRAPLSGVFLDEAAAAPEYVGHHAVIARRARAAGARWVLANPGCAFDRAYLELFDSIGSFEGDAAAHARLAPPEWMVDLPPGKLFHLVHGVGAGAVGATMRRMRRWGVASGFVTDDGGEPWTRLPPYVGDLRVLAGLPAPH